MIPDQVSARAAVEVGDLSLADYLDMCVKHGWATDPASGTALVFGRGGYVWEEIAAAMELCTFDQVIAVNRAGCDYRGKLDHWVSFHADLFPLWIAQRSKNGYDLGMDFWTNAHGRKRSPLEDTLGVRHVDCMGGSSGKVAVEVALHIGCTKVILAGIPMEPAHGHYDESGAWDEALIHRRAWEKDYERLAPFVRSMSGWTKDKFGVPTREWLKACLSDYSHRS